MLQTTFDSDIQTDEEHGPRHLVWFQAPTDEGRDPIPTGLDDIPPGAILAAIVSSLDVDRLSGHDRILVLRAHQRLASHYAAQVLTDMNAIADSFVEDGLGTDLAVEAGAAEIRAALHLTRFSANNEMVLALDLRERIPRVHELLNTGQIDARRARVIADSTMHLPDEMADRVVDEIAAKAPSLTTDQLRARIRKLYITIEPSDADLRYTQAVDSRRIMTMPSPAGTANFYAMDLPPALMETANRRIDHIAKKLRRDGEERTMDQLRADVFLDLLNGTGHGTVAKGVVDIRVDLETLAGLAENPGNLGRFGPVVADIARKTAEQQQNGDWRFLVGDPVDGRPVAAGTTRRRTTASQRRTVELLRPVCKFPGCRMPATQSDLDHTIPWSKRQETKISGLCPLCRADHTIRHDAGWEYTIADNGDIHWTSPLNHKYTVPRESDP